MLCGSDLVCQATFAPENCLVKLSKNNVIPEFQRMFFQPLQHLCFGPDKSFGMSILIFCHCEKQINLGKISFCSCFRGLSPWVVSTISLWECIAEQGCSFLCSQEAETSAASLFYAVLTVYQPEDDGTSKHSRLGLEDVSYVICLWEHIHKAHKSALVTS